MVITVDKINQLKQKIESGITPNTLFSDILNEHIRDYKGETVDQRFIYQHTLRALLSRLKEESLKQLDAVIEEINNPKLIQKAESDTFYKKPSFTPIKTDNTCILYKKFVKLDFFKNTFKTIKSIFNLPLFYLDYNDLKTEEIPPFDLNQTKFKKAILWQDNYYPIWDQIQDYYPIISGNRCIGPLTIDLEKFKEKYTDIIKYDDISFGYLKETNSFIEGRDPDTYEMDSKVCCRKKREYFNKKVVSVEDGGIPYIDLLPSLKQKIKGE